MKTVMPFASRSPIRCIIHLSRWTACTGCLRHPLSGGLMRRQWYQCWHTSHSLRWTMCMCWLLAAPTLGWFDEAPMAPVLAYKSLTRYMMYMCWLLAAPTLRWFDEVPTAPVLATIVLVGNRDSWVKTIIPR